MDKNELLERLQRLSDDAADLRRDLKLADGDLLAERLVTPDDMKVGDWFRPMGSHTWRQIEGVHKQGRRWRSITWMFGGIRHETFARDYDTLPYQSAEGYNKDCDAEQADVLNLGVYR